jgi:hypothetical protein
MTAEPCGGGGVGLDMRALPFVYIDGVGGAVRTPTDNIGFLFCFYTVIITNPRTAAVMEQNRLVRADDTRDKLLRVKLKLRAAPIHTKRVRFAQDRDIVLMLKISVKVMTGNNPFGPFRSAFFKKPFSFI